MKASGYRTFVACVCGHHVMNPVWIGHLDGKKGERFPVCSSCVGNGDVRSMVMVRWGPCVVRRMNSYTGPKEADRQRAKRKLMERRTKEQERIMKLKEGSEA